MIRGPGLSEELTSRHRIIQNETSNHAKPRFIRCGTSGRRQHHHCQRTNKPKRRVVTDQHHTHWHNQAHQRPVLTGPTALCLHRWCTIRYQTAWEISYRPHFIGEQETRCASQAVQLFDKVFYDHGIVATHVDEKHVVLTYRSAKK